MEPKELSFLEIEKAFKMPLLFHFLKKVIKRKLKTTRQFLFFQFFTKCLNVLCIIVCMNISWITISFNGRFILSVFINLLMAFDTVDHQILLKKLKYYGVNEKTLAWLWSYLFQRKQYIENTNVIKYLLKTDCSVPKGVLEKWDPRPHKWHPRPGTLIWSSGMWDPGPLKWDVESGAPKFSSGTRDPWSRTLMNNILAWKFEYCNKSIDKLKLEN